VAVVMKTGIPVLPVTATMKDVPSSAPGVVVLTKDGIAAAFSTADLRGGGDQSASLASLLEEEITYPHVHPDQPLEDALERIEDAETNAIAVLDRADVRHVLGLITLADLRDAFRRTARL
jgi:CBS domain-containing protein